MAWRGRNLRWQDRVYVFTRDDFTCVYCGVEAETLDHVIPFNLGGGGVVENVVVACKACNSKKGGTKIYVAETVIAFEWLREVGEDVSWLRDFEISDYGPHDRSREREALAKVKAVLF